MSYTEYSIQKESVKTGKISNSIFTDGKLTTLIRKDATELIKERAAVIPGYRYRLVTTEYGDWTKNEQEEEAPVGQSD